MRSLPKFLLLSVLLIGGSLNASAQGDTTYSFIEENLLEIVLGLAVVVSVIVLVVLIVLLNVLQAFVRKQYEDAVAAGQEVPIQAEASLFGGLFSKLTDAVPIEREADVLTDHEYDGIRELDNNLPPWWTYMFYITIVFAVVYFGYYHIFGGPSSLDEYKEELAIAEAQMASFAEASGQQDAAVDENNLIVITDGEQLALAKGLYIQYCAACHANDGGGGIGPNLTDEYWINGGGISNIYRTIKVGVPQKGMISWESTLSPSQMQVLSSLIISMQGTSTANPKEPQGDKWIEEVTEVTESTP